MTEPLPDQLDEQRQRTWLIAGVLSVVVVLIAVGVVFGILTLRKPPASTGTFTPAEQTQPATVTPVATSGTSVTPSVITTGSTSTSTATSTTPAGQIVRSGRIAYRLKNEIYVANEDGSQPQAILPNTAGPFSLSPDGRTLVLMPSGGTALLVDVVTKVQVPIAYANVPGQLPVWAPDSSWLAYTWQPAGNVGYAIRRVSRDGTGDGLLVTAGARPAISPDGVKVAFLKAVDPSIISTEPVHVFNRTTGKTTDVPNSKGARYYAFAPGGSLFVAGEASGGWIRSADKAISKTTSITALGLDAASALNPLYPSPDGSKVLFAISGEDMHPSVLQVVDVSAKKITPVTSSATLDAIPVGWLLDGSGYLDLEGDLVGSGKTYICRRNADGSHRKVIVTGGTF